MTAGEGRRKPSSSFEIMLLCFGEKRVQINPFLNKTQLTLSALQRDPVMSLQGEQRQTLLQWGYELRIIVRWHPKCQAVQDLQLRNIHFFPVCNESPV